jgi:uncharacterized protein YndB with AHSA1/START domain
MTHKVERDLDLPAGIEQAWQALTESQWLERWLADEVELELWPGGKARFRVGETERRGWVEEVSAPSNRDPSDRPHSGRLVFWWAEDDEPASRVELTVTPAGEQTTSICVVETRPLADLDLIGLPGPGVDGSIYGPALIAA